MNTYHPQIKNKLGFPAADWAKGRGEKTAAKSKTNAKDTSGWLHPKIHIIGSWTMKRCLLQQLRFCWALGSGHFSFFCSQEQAPDPIALRLTECQIIPIKRCLLLSAHSWEYLTMSNTHMLVNLTSYGNIQLQLTHPLHALTSCQYVLRYPVAQESGSAELEAHMHMAI